MRMILSVYLVKNLQIFAKLSIVGISNKFTTIQPSLRMPIIPTNKYRSSSSRTNQVSKNNLCNEFRNNWSNFMNWKILNSSGYSLQTMSRALLNRKKSVLKNLNQVNMGKSILKITLWKMFRGIILFLLTLMLLLKLLLGILQPVSIYQVRSFRRLLNIWRI